MTCVVSAAKTSVGSADKTSVVSQDIPTALRRRPQHARVGNGVGKSWETTDALSAARVDVLTADILEVSSADAAGVLFAGTSQATCLGYIQHDFSKQTDTITKTQAIKGVRFKAPSPKRLLAITRNAWIHWK